MTSNDRPDVRMVPPQRAAGWMHRPLSGGTSDHVCWGYASGAERAEIATSWLGDGLRQGQRALYVADAPPDRLLEDLADLAGRSTALAGGALVILSADEVYDLSRPIDSGTQLAAYDEAVTAAVRAGYRGLRVAADITALVSDPTRRPAHLHWEQVAERYIATHPLAPLCMYDVRRVPDITAIASAHPAQGPGEATFCVYGTGATRVALQGEVDACVASTFAEVLHALPDTDRVVDVANLSFVDAHSAWLLSDEMSRRRAAGQPVSLDGVSSMLRRIWAICELDASLLEPV